MLKEIYDERNLNRYDIYILNLFVYNKVENSMNTRIINMVLYLLDYIIGLYASVTNRIIRFNGLDSSQTQPLSIRPLIYMSFPMSTLLIIREIFKTYHKVQ